MAKAKGETMKKIPGYGLVAMLLLFSPMLVQAEGRSSYSIAGFDDAAKVEQFATKLQQWVAQDDKTAIAGVIRFPIKVRLTKGARTLKGKKEFLLHYPEIFNSKVKDAVLRQDRSNLFVNWQGAMFGDGEVWIRPTDDQAIQIIAINN